MRYFKLSLAALVAALLVAELASQGRGQEPPKPESKSQPDAAEKALTVKVPLPDFRKHVQFVHDNVIYATFVTFYHRVNYRDLDHYRRIQPEIIISAPYLQYALWWKGLAKLDCLKDSKEPVRWLRQNLKAELVHGPAVWLRWVGKPIPEAAQIVKAVAEIYSEEGLDRRYSKRAWRIAYLQKMASQIGAAILEREKALADGRYDDNAEHKAGAMKSVEIHRKAKQDLEEQLRAVRRGDNVPALYFKETAYGPVRIEPKDPKPKMTWLTAEAKNKPASFSCTMRPA